MVMMNDKEIVEMVVRQTIAQYIVHECTLTELLEVCTVKALTLKNALTEARSEPHTVANNRNNEAAAICRETINGFEVARVKNFARKIGSTLVPDGAWYVGFKFELGKEPW